MAKHCGALALSWMKGVAATGKRHCDLCQSHFELLKLCGAAGGVVGLSGDHDAGDAAAAVVLRGRSGEFDHGILYSGLWAVPTQTVTVG